MKLIYEEVKDEFGSVIKCTKEDGSILWIPTDPANSDYQRYLNPEAEQSTPNLTV
jgi:hypothetical protein